MSALTNFDSTVNSFYLAFYGRPADPAGLAFWSAQLAINHGDLGAITAAFATSEEAQVRFGADSVNERIAQIYQQLFNRAPDTEGLAYWTQVVRDGHASVADVAIAILDGARGIDAGLSALRLQAADAFTAQVGASNTGYSGYAAVEAARVLVRAVTVNTTTADVDVLVQAAVSFADTASKTPDVVAAIAAGSTLLGLFDTGRGQADPVGLARMLADTAKAAAGNPVTLESLLRGGGIDQVLKVMPSGTSLQDVVDALAKGGLPAAVEVVYPPASAPVVKPTPVADIKLDFLAVTQGEGDTSFDHVTSLDLPAVAFTYSGRELKTGETFEFSLDNTHWSGKNIELVKQSYANIVALSGIDLSQGTPLQPQPSFTLQGSGSTDDLGTTVYLRVVDAGGKVLASISQDLVYDHFAAAPLVSAAPNDATPHFAHLDPQVTDFTLVSVDGIEAGAKVEYLDHGKWTSAAPAFAEGEHTVTLRQTDVSGNVSAATEFTFTIDSDAPDAPTLALLDDTGVDTEDGITANPLLVIGGLEQSIATGWQYRAGENDDWVFGGRNNGASEATLDLRALAQDSGTVYVRQIDAAGNVGDAVALAYTLDMAAPANTIGFMGISGQQAGVFATTQDTAALTMSLAGDAGDSVQWRVKNGGSWLNAIDNDDGTFSTASINLLGRDPVIEVRRLDAAGNASAATEQVIDGPWTRPDARSNVSFGIYTMGAAASSVRLFSSPSNVVQVAGSDGESGLLDRDGVALLDLRTGVGVATAVDYTDGAGFGMQATGELTFDAPLKTGVYKLQWGENAIATGTGSLNAGALAFMGGVDGHIVQKGTVVNEIVLLTSSYSVADGQVANQMLIDSGAANGHFAGGGGFDVIADNGGTLHIDYTSFDAFSDLLIGLDTGNDTVNFKGVAGVAIDDDEDGAIAWATGVEGVKTVVDAADEGVEVYIDGVFATAELATAGSATLATLNAAIDLSGIAGALQADQDHMDFLILVQDPTGTGGALVYFQNRDDDAVIDADEVWLVGVLTDGMLATTDIHVLGTMTG